MKDLNHYVEIYKKEMEKGDIPIAYAGLVKYVMSLGNTLAKNLSDKYSFGSLLQGYMDYTYFYYSNSFLKERKLKMGLVLNHQKVHFEIWLLGQTAPVQKKYWNFFKDKEWNAGRTEMPKYSILETVLIENPDFSHLDALSLQIEEGLVRISNEIERDVKSSRLD
ncbi:MAG TPA: hypothetical protein PLC52_04290 [Anaerolineales bacterium]|mgnify:FL=1|nr:hypothetical protein [Anaerolineales bacterium]HRQ92070.1 hypothetical protein [Anaerolineales bacterium]